MTALSTLKRWQRACVIAVAASLIAGVLGALFTYVYITEDIETQNQYAAKLTLRDIEFTGDRVRDFISTVEEAGQLNCSQSTLQILRNFIYNTAAIADVGIYGRKGLKCTAMRGPFVVEVATPPLEFSFDNGGGLLSNPVGADSEAYGKAGSALPYGSDVNMHAIRQGDLLVLIDALPIINHPPRGADWEIVFRSADNYVHSEGTAGLFGRDLQGDLFFEGVASTECSVSIQFCITILTPWSSVLSQRSSVVGVGGFGTVVFALFLLVLWRKSKATLISSRARAMNALKKGLYYCHYQPIVDVNTCTVIGCEAVARMEDHIGFMSPADFIPAMSETVDLKQRFTEMMFNEAYSGLKNLDWPHAKPFKFSFNIFPENLNNRMVKFLKTHPALSDPRLKVCLEITEDSSISDEAYERIVRAFGRMGVDASVDDFGTGYGNLKRIEIPGVKWLKIDKSLITNLTRENVKDSLTLFIPLLAKKSQLSMIAEGVETEENLLAVKELGIQYVQGYFFGRPQPSDEFCELVDQWDPSLYASVGLACGAVIPFVSGFPKRNP